jgi:hypothetical protein
MDPSTASVISLNSDAEPLSSRRSFFCFSYHRRHGGTTDANAAVKVRRRSSPVFP